MIDNQVAIRRLESDMEQRQAFELQQQAEDEAPPFVQVLGPELDRLEQLKLAPLDVAPTPFRSWNLICRDEGGGKGLARGWHIIIGGNSGYGKSLLAINLAAHAVANGEKVGIISLEMSKPQCMTRFMAIFSGGSIRKLEWGSSYDKETAYTAKSLIEENYDRNGGVLLTNERPMSSLADIVAAMRYLYEYQGCRYFITDYLQLAWAGNAQNATDRITEVSHAIRGEAVDLSVVSVGVSQFSRAISRADESPVIQGLMGGSALENDSNQVLLLDHSTYKETGETGAIIKLLVAKNRHGSRGEVPLMWDYSTLRVKECDAREFEEGAT
jgi:replicative DNA helicase